MSNDPGLDLKLMVDIQEAEKQIDKFLKDVQKKYKNAVYSPTGSSTSSGKASSSKQQQQQNKATQQQQKNQKQQVNNAQKTADKLAKIHADALHRYELAEIQRGQVTGKASKRVAAIRARYEAEVAKIMRNANASNIAETQRALAKELALHKRALNEKVKSERQLAAEELAGKNHDQKKASKLNNSVFQVQQAIEDASYAGFRGASNNLALMANQLGGHGGTIAMIGLMATTLTPTIMKLAGFNEETQKSTDRLKEQTEALIANRDARLNADIETKNTPFSSEDLRNKRQELLVERNAMKMRADDLNDRRKKNYYQEAYLQAQFREDLLGTTAFDQKGPLAYSNFLKKEAARMSELGLGPAEVEANTPNGEHKFQNIARELAKRSYEKQKEAERKIREELGDNTLSPYRKDPGMWEAEWNKSSNYRKGTYLKDDLRKAADAYRESYETDSRAFEKDNAKLEQSNKNIRKYSNNVLSAMDNLKNGTEAFNLSEVELIKKPKDAIQSLEISNKELETKFEEQKEIIEKGLENFLIEGEMGLKTAPHTERDEVAKQFNEQYAEKQKEVTQEINKQKSLIDKKIEANNKLIETLESIEDKHKDITKEIESSVSSHKKKVESLQEQLQLGQQNYEFGKLSAESSITDMKIKEQGKGQLSKAEKMIGKRFDPMIRYLQFMSKSPVFGQAASQQLQAVQQAKSTMLGKAKTQIEKHIEKKLFGEQKDLLGKQSDFLKSKAAAAGASGDFDKQQKYLEQLQGLLLQASGKSKTPGEAQNYLDQADKVQSQIVSSMNNQITLEKQSINELTKIEAQLIQIKSILQGNPNSTQAQNAQKTLDGLQKKVENINAGKLPIQALPPAVAGKAPVNNQTGSGVINKMLSTMPTGKKYKVPLASNPKHPELKGMTQEEKVKALAEKREHGSPSLTPGLSAAVSQGLIPSLANSLLGNSSVKTGPRELKGQMIQSSLPMPGKDEPTIEELRKQMYTRYEAPKDYNPVEEEYKNLTHKRVELSKKILSSEEHLLKIQKQVNADYAAWEEKMKDFNEERKNSGSTKGGLRGMLRRHSNMGLNENSLRDEESEIRKRMGRVSQEASQHEVLKAEWKERISEVDEAIHKLLEDDMNKEQQITQSHTNQATTNSATINNAVINSATINGVSGLPPVSSNTTTSNSNVVNNRFDALNVNVRGPALPNIPRQLQRQSRNTSTRMGT